MPVYVYCNNPTQTLKDLNIKIRNNTISKWAVHLGSHYTLTLPEYENKAFLLARVGQGRLVFNIKFNVEDQQSRQHLYAFYTTTMVATFIEHLSLDYPELYAMVSAPVSKESNVNSNIIDDWVH